MSTIPKGLRADIMRARMLDKGTISKIGSLYMRDASNNIIELSPSAQSNLVLCSKGTGVILEYQTLKEGSINAGAVTKSKVGNGGVVTNEALKQFLSIEEDSEGDISITFTPTLPNNN